MIQLTTPAGELLREIPLDDIEAAAPSAVDEATRVTARSIVDSVRAGGEAVLREYATGLDGLQPEAPLTLDRAAMERAADGIAPATRSLLERTAARIRRFAEAALLGRAYGQRGTPSLRHTCLSEVREMPSRSAASVWGLPKRDATPW